MSVPAGAHVGSPRFFNLGVYRINSYKCFLIVGLYAGTVAAAALADSVGQSPLAVGLAAMGSGLAGLVGARLYHMAIHTRLFMRPGSHHLLWDGRRGGAAVFGALLTFVPASYAAAGLLSASTADLWTSWVAACSRADSGFVWAACSTAAAWAEKRMARSASVCYRP